MTSSRGCLHAIRQPATLLVREHGRTPNWFGDYLMIGAQRT
jgi:hypothetical protein